MPQYFPKIILSLLAILAVLFVFNTVNTADEAQKTETATVAESAQEELPADFRAFYTTWQSDSTFQMDHILFPLKGIAFYEDGTTSDTTWTADGWVIHQPFNDFEGTYERTFQVLGTAVTETIYSSQYNFSMVRRFAKLQDEYALIYYQPMGPNQ